MFTMVSFRLVNDIQVSGNLFAREVRKIWFVHGTYIRWQLKNCRASNVVKYFFSEKEIKICDCSRYNQKADQVTELALYVRIYF